LVDGNAVIGLVNKYNAPAAVMKSKVGEKKIQAIIYEGGWFAAVIKSKPTSVKVNGNKMAYDYSDNLLIVDIPVSQNTKRVKVEVEL
jgi:hypothetical protein